MPGLVLQLAVQVGAVVHHPGQIGIRTHLADQAGRVPGRAAGQFVTFQDDNIFPTHERQMVCNAAPANASTNDDYLSMSGKIRHFYLPP